VKSALFVDFDNVYSGLRRLDQANADQFALRPTEWMNWVINSLALPEHVRDGAKRRVLVRRCYLNPQAYQRFRSSFNLAGFEIIDCPALTSEGKTSTDIHMVLDIIDLLQHEVHYDEFVVFSADADFTPVLRKLRRWDRRTTVLAIGFPSAAYRASADLLIDQDEFIREALDFRDEVEPIAEPVVPKADPNVVVTEAVNFLKQKVAESPAPVPLAKLAGLILTNVGGIDAATWAGLGNFRGLIETRDLSPLKVEWGEGGGIIYDPKRHALPASAAAGTQGRRKADVDLKRIAELIKGEVGSASQPVPCGRLASLITSHYGALAADWNGKGVFRKFVESLDLDPVKFDWNASGGCAYDPRRHTLSRNHGAEAGTHDWSTARDLLPVAKQVHDATGVPLLPPTKYRALFNAVAADVAAHPFDFIESGKRIRDLCRDSGEAVNRADVNFVLRGLLMRGHTFGQGDDNADALSRKLADNVRSLCLREQILLDDATESAIASWIAGGE